MASVYKRKGQQNWQIGYRNAAGEYRRRSSGSPLHAKAVQIAHELERPWRLTQEGLLSGVEALRMEQDDLPLGQHVADYLDQVAAAGRTDRTVADYRARLGWLVAHTGAQRLSDLTLDAVSTALASMHAEGKSARTRNYHGQVARSFLAWCVRSGRLLTNPLEHLAKANEARDQRRLRRPLSDAEVERLYAVADARGRGLFYRLAFMAGLRLGEIKRLRWADVDLGARVLLVRGGKAAREDAVPISSALRGALSAAVPGLPAARVLASVVTNATRRRDYRAAGIDEVDANGLHADLHSARMTLHHQLVRARVAPQVCQAILRHSDYRTTERYYSRLGDLRSDDGFAQVREGIERVGLAKDEPMDKREEQA